MSTGPAQVAVLPSSCNSNSNSNNNNNNINNSNNNNNNNSSGHSTQNTAIIPTPSQPPTSPRTPPQSSPPPSLSSSSQSPQSSSALASALVGTSAVHQHPSKMAATAVSAATAIGASTPLVGSSPPTTSISPAAAATGMLISSNNNNNNNNQINNNNNNSVVSTTTTIINQSNVTATQQQQTSSSSTQQLKDSVPEPATPDPVSRHNSLGGKQRSLGGKGKHLTRSHAMRESTSPPRTPTPRSPSDQQQAHNTTGGSPGQHNSSNNSLSISGEPVTSTSNNSSSIHSPVSNNNNEYSSQQMSSNNSSNHSPSIVFYGGGSAAASDERGGKSQLDLDFPKLTPPKSSFQANNGAGSGGKNGGRSNNSNKSDHDHHHHQQQHPNGAGKKGCESVASHDYKESGSKSQMLDPGSELPLKSGNGNKSSSSNNNNTSSSSPVSSNNNYCDNENRNLREVNCNANSNDSNNQINIQFSHEENRYIQCESPTDSLIRNNSSSNSNLNSSAHNNKKHRPSGNVGSGGMGGGGGGMPGGGGNLTGKGNKPRLKHMSGGSSSSVDGGGGCPGGGGGPSAEFLSRDNSCEQFTDQSGVNLIQFFKETLNKNFKDRNMLMKIEKELLALAMDRSRSQIKFPPMSSYNRMLIHRVAAYFGMEHNVDATQQSVIAEVTPATRIPDIRFKTLINESFSDEPRKSILKRDTHSFDEYRYGLLHCPDRGVLDRKAKSFEEREEEYEKAKRRIFKNREESGSEEQWQWLSAENAEPMNGRPKLQNNRLLKVQSVSIEGRSDERPCVSKSHSFGGYGGSSQNASLLRGDSITSTKSAGARLFSKQDSNASTNTPWRLSPSSSGYKTQSIRSDSVTPSPTGYGSGDHTPEPCIQSPSSTCGVVWAVTDMASVPKGSVLIDPQTLQPIVNQDGSIYHYDPSNLPATANLPGSVGRSQRKKFEKQKSFSNRNPLNSSSSLESSIDIPLGKNDCGQQTNTTTTIAEEVGSELCYDMTTGTVKISTKDNHDIDENSSLCEEISQTTNELSTFKLQKHQATSPMLQASELQPLELSEIQLNANHEDRGSLEAITPTGMTESEPVATLMVAVPSSSDLGLKSDSHHPQHHVHMPIDENSNDAASEHSQDTLDNGKKDETSNKINVISTVPMMSYSNSVTPNSSYTMNFDNCNSTPGASGTTAVYTSGTPGMSTTYQTAPDGTIYAVPSPLVYTYPSTMDQEMSGYFVPVYDQQRGETSLCTATGAPIYHPSAAGATSTVLPIAYTPATATYNGTPIYQNPTTAVMYSSDQFTGATPGPSSAAAAAAAAAAGSLQQYPIGYPIGIGYPFNNAAYQNYWNQPITYYVPQTPVASAGSTPLMMPPPVSQTPTNSGMIATAPTPLSGKRNTTPPGHGSHSQNQNQSASVTPVPISPFATNIPVPMADPTGGPLYAIPQPIYSNMLPFAGPMAPHHPHHHPAAGGTIMNSVLPTATAAATTGYHPHSQSNAGNSDSLTSSNGSSHNIYSNANHTNNAPTPQSTPGTPLSLPLSLPPHAKNPPLFATPPILSNGYAPQMGPSGASSGGAGHHHYHSNNGGNSNYEDRKSSGSSGGYQGKRSNQSSGNYFNYNNNNNSRQMTPNSSGGSGSYQGNTGNTGPKNSGFANTTNTGNNHNASGALMLGQPPKTSAGQPRSESQANITKPPLIPTLPNSNNSTSSNTNPSDKSRINRSSKPPNLDLKRNFSNFNVNSRNTPSTNSTESNNSPNSITSSSVHEHHHSHHPQGQHHPTNPQPSFYPQQQPAPPSYYHHQHRGGSVGSNSGAAGGVAGASGAGGAAAAAAAAAAAHSMPSNAIQTAVAAAACAAAIEPYHSQLIPLNATGMSYVKIGQTYFTHPSLALPPSRRSPPNDIRPIAGVYPAMNMVMPATRQFTPRPQHSNSYKGSRAPR